MDVSYLLSDDKEEAFEQETYVAGGGFVSTEKEENALEASIEEVKQSDSFKEEKKKERASAEDQQVDAPSLDTAENEKMDSVQDDITFVKSFSGQKEVKAKAVLEDEELSKVQEDVEKFSEDFSDENLLLQDKDEGYVEELKNTLEDISKSCEDYIDNKDPVLPHSRHRMELVRNLKDKADAIQQAEIEGGTLTGVVDLLCDRLHDRSGNGQDAAGDDGDNPDDNKNNQKRLAGQKRFYQGAEQMGAKSVLPMEFDVETSELKERSSSEYVDYQTLVKDQSFDEIKMSSNALDQLARIKIVGFLFGIADWQDIIDPEKLLYEEKNGTVNSVQLTVMPGIADIPEKMSAEEAEKFAKSLLGADSNALEILAGSLSDANLMVGPLAAAVGVSAGVLFKRLKALLICVDAIKKGREISSLNKAVFR